LNSRIKKKNYRWVLLRHTSAPGDKRGFHFDFLLEDKKFCRTWRLSDIPLLDGPYVDCEHIAPHNLSWLDIKEKAVSGNRGFATRTKNGIFLESLPSIENSFIKLPIVWDCVERDLLIDENGCRILTKKY
tara:strand:+ start:64 stop:453 length:390 start_codon:yes stop_codon:yes gene_type:complete